jgi:hypothetical protein
MLRSIAIHVSCGLVVLGACPGCSSNPASPADAALDAPIAVPDLSRDSAPPPPTISSLSAGPEAPIYATYAAPLARSAYMVDEGYRLVYSDPARPLVWSTDTAGMLGFIWKSSAQVVYKTGDYSQRPTVVRSYADSGQLTYSPVEGILVSHSFAVYSSKLLLMELTIANTTGAPRSVTVAPFYYRSGGAAGADLPASHDRLLFSHTQPVNLWSETSLAGYEPDHQDLVLVDFVAEDWGGYTGGTMTELLTAIGQGALNKSISGAPNTLAVARSFTIDGGKEARLRLVRGVDQASRPASDLQAAAAKLLKDGAFVDLFTQSEQTYARIPRLKTVSVDEDLVYWQSFSLVRQMMLPPEGESGFNYYVFSREPTWGWGHDGQVFHESLVMLAYVYMDPKSAMDSQRVYMQRQAADGYIHYRIGPYIARDFPDSGEKTSSAPFYSWINWEIFLVAKDRTFLEEAYASSVKYVNYMMTTRDKNGNGLYEWGGTAFLESVRDGENVVWKALALEGGTPRSVEALDLNCMIVNELSSLAAMAEELGKKDEAQTWRGKASALADKINSRMWDETTQFYYHIDRDTGTFTTKKGTDLKRMEIIGLLPLWAGIVPPARVPLLIQHLKNPSKFWRKDGVPSLAADDAGYSGTATACCRWNGPVWFPWEYLIERGLLRYGYKDEAKELVRRNVAAAAEQLKLQHAFFESYSPDADVVSTIAPYVWDGILARMMIDLR